MARPKKNNADYFTHDADMRNDVKIKALRRKFSHTGYAVWNYLLETLTDCNFFEVEWAEINIELLAADYDVSVDELTEIVEYCVKIGLLQREGNFLLSAVHKKRLSGVIEYREQQHKNGKKGGNPNLRKGQPNPYYNRGKDNPEITDGYGYTEETLPKDKQSKVKESKVNISLSSPTSRARERGETVESSENGITSSVQEIQACKSKVAIPEKGCAEKVPPAVMPEGTYEYIPIRQIADYLKGNIVWLEAFCMNNHLSLEFVRGKIDEFSIECQNSGETSKHKRDCIRHFNNWLRKNKNYEPRGTTSRSTHGDISLDDFDRATRERVARRLASDPALPMGSDSGGPFEPF